MEKNSFISVAVIAPIDRELTYSVPPELREALRLGQRVAVPLGRRKAVGIVLRAEAHKPSIDCKPIEALLDEDPTFTPRQMEFLKWASRYYLTPLGEMIRTALPSGMTRVKKGERKRKETRSGKPEAGKDVKKAEGKKQSLQLTDSQQNIVDSIFSSPSADGFSVHLIHGVTGSGKTEVYFAVLEKILSSGKQAICLVPEIALTPQTLRRYTEHFGDQVISYHSGLSEGERLKVWERCRKGEASVLIGTRSALFAPFRNLGLIVIDEEQDGSYKQEERSRYHARDLAIVRGKIEKIPILLGSATPSVETYYKAKTGKFFYHELTERYGAAELPKIEVVDLRVEHGEEKKKPSLLSPRLLEEIEANLKEKEQTLIFLNRRGFSHFLLCQDCGHTPTCPNCDITLTYHRKSIKLLCHYCDYRIPPPEVCPKCQGLDWRPLGHGTERIEEDLEDFFPEARIERMDRDTTSRKGSHQSILQKLKDREIDILVGTQMIAKGHDYPFVTLVGILMADASLHLPDFRAAEQTFHLITQVAGRAGRAASPGRVLLQTFSPEHLSLEAAAAHRLHEFYEEELKGREELGYPPYQRLIVLKVQGTQQIKVKKGIEALRRLLETLQNKKKIPITILGPAACLLEKLRNFYRWQILIKGPSGQSLQAMLKEHVMDTQDQWLPSGLRLVVDVDPVSVI